MRRAYWDQQATIDDDAASYAYSGPHSASTMSHNSPATPHTTFEGDLEDSSKTVTHGEKMIRDVDQWMDEYLRVDALADFSQIPGLNRTMSEVYQDELYQPPSATSVPHQPQLQQQQRPTFNQTPSHLTPYRKVFHDRLQAMNQANLTARSQSPAVSIGRERSPFREGSKYAQQVSGYGGQGNIQAQVHSAAQLREQQKAEADAIVMAQHQPRPDQYETPKTISPKDAVLDYHETPEDAAMPLFPQSQSSSSQYSQQPTSLSREESSFSVPPTYGQFTNPLSAPHISQQYPFLSHRQRQTSSMQSAAADQNPEFPAHLTSMESTASEATMTVPPSSQTSTSHPRPEDTSSDAGTYTCTYHGCTLRFETPAKLQKHKRDAHRQTSPSAAPSPGGMTSSAVSLRNSQAGPHKCDRINPSTGKPCSSIFSRPYDLTRHEDTIHNARKQKVRCQFCAEEKSFSRNDALTRHMRVVHPDLEWPGKKDRKNARH